MPWVQWIYSWSLGWWKVHLGTLLLLSLLLWFIEALWRVQKIRIKRKLTLWAWSPWLWFQISWVSCSSQDMEHHYSNYGTGEDSWEISTRRSNQSILREINSEYLLGRLTLKLKFQYFGHLIWTVDSLEKLPDAGKDWGKEKRASEMAGWHYWCNGHELGQSLGDGDGQGGPLCCSPWGHKESDTTEQMNNNSLLLKLLTPTQMPWFYFYIQLPKSI